MRGIDTNVLVRYLTKDDLHQSAVASRYIKNSKERILIDSIVLCELVWVLRGAYGCSKEVITEILERILFTEQFEIEERDLTWNALNEFKLSKADFSDCLIGQKNKSFGCEKTATFDRNLKDLQAFELL